MVTMLIVYAYLDGREVAQHLGDELARAAVTGGHHRVDLARLEQGQRVGE
jgi:hypothetical protein